MARPRVDMDGSPSEFPHRQEAMVLYRELWLAFLVSQSPERRELFAKAMDEEQLRIARGPGTVWQEFTDTLPGYAEWWERQVEQLEEEVVRW